MSICIVAVAGCDDKTNGDAARDPALEEAKEEISEAAEATSDYLTQEKEEYEKAVADDLVEIGEQIEDLQQMAANASGEAKAKIQDAIDALKKQKNDVQAKLNELRQKAPDAWKELRKGLDAALGELKDAFNKAKDKLQPEDKDE